MAVHIFRWRDLLEHNKKLETMEKDKVLKALVIPQFTIETIDTWDSMLDSLGLEEATSRIWSGAPYRGWSRGKAYLKDPKKGETIKSTRAFGIELEAMYRSERYLNGAAKLTSCDIGITRDSGAEFQTPPAIGSKAEKMINSLCRVLKAFRFECGKGQGLHVHIDATDLIAKGVERWKYIRDLWLFYIAFDDVLRKVIPSHRRGNSTCKKTLDRWDKVMACTNQGALEEIWYLDQDELSGYEFISERKSHLKDGSRYRGFNLHTIFHADNLEIRYHEGTIKAREILEWANLHCLIMDKVLEGIDLEWLAKIKNKKFFKRRELAKFLGLEARSRTYWNSRADACS